MRIGMAWKGMSSVLSGLLECNVGRDVLVCVVALSKWIDVFCCYVKLGAL
jgi:hypothetical protein